MWHKLPVVAVVLTVFVGPAEVRADEPFVDPYESRSPSGEWVLQVTPSAAGGEGKAAYRMQHAGKEAWSKDMPVTLRECVVGDKGSVIGYAYDTGYMGWWDAHLVVLGLTPEGEIRTNESHDRQMLAGVDPTPPGEPRGEGMVLDRANRRAILLVSSREDRASTEWWLYSLDDATALGHQKPEGPHKGQYSFSRQLASLPVPGTTLVAVQWLIWEQNVSSASFELIDREGKVVWTRRIDREYAGMPEGWRWWELKEKSVRQLEVTDAGIAIVSYSDKQRTKYAVAKDEQGAWKVTEAGKEPAVPAESNPAAPPLELTKRDLRPVGEVHLGNPAPAGGIDGVHSLCFDDRGRMGWVRWTPDDAKPKVSFVLADGEGKIQGDFDLDLGIEKMSLPQPAWLEGDRWVIVGSDYSGKESTARAWFVDVAAKKATPIEDFTGGHVKRVCRAPDGGFFVLSGLHGNYTIRDQVAKYDRDGKRVSEKTEAGYGHGLSIQDIAVLSDGALATLSMFPDKVTVLRPGQKDATAWLLEDVLAEGGASQRPYIANLRADKDGGLIVYDSANQNLLHRIDKEGKRWQSFHVRGPKGETFRLYDAFAVDPDGRVWGSDGSRVYRCGEDGKADLALGGPAEGTMADPVAVTLDRAGSIYALERGTAAVHVFDAGGKPVRVMRPLPEDTPTQDALAWIRVAEDGRVRYRMGYEAPIVIFGADGKRIGTERPPERWKKDEEQPWDPVPGGGWETNGSALRRLGPDGSVVKTIAHRPGGAWLVTVMDACAAADGSVAVLSERNDPASWGFGRGPLWVCVYGPDGSGRGELPIPRTSMFHTLKYDGTRVLLPDEKGVTVLVVPLMARAERYELPGEKKYWHVMLRPDGTLATWASGARAVQKWEIPK